MFVADQIIAIPAMGKSFTLAEFRKLMNPVEITVQGFTVLYGLNGLALVEDDGTRVYNAFLLHEREEGVVGIQCFVDVPEQGEPFIHPRRMTSEPLPIPAD
jgi:hypothetical protein